MRIAIVSTDGKNVDDHFGKAERFLVYDITAGKQALVEDRPATPLSVGDPEHAFDPDRFGAIADTLSDCERVYVTRIGDVPSDKLKERGIEPVVYTGAIQAITP